MADADVLVVAFGEARADEGAALLRGRRLVAPGLLWYEMSEVARVKCAARPAEAQAILEQFEAARSLPVVLHAPDWAALPGLALDTGLTAYDAAYLSLAQALGAPLATFDRRLERIGRGLWKDRQDLPDFEVLRREFDRTSGAGLGDA
jgi:predicted nucleic acid-binding protein